MTLEDLEMKIRALPGVASDPHTVPALIALVLEYEDAASCPSCAGGCYCPEHAATPKQYPSLALAGS